MIDISILVPTAKKVLPPSRLPTSEPKRKENTLCVKTPKSSPKGLLRPLAFDSRLPAPALHLSSGDTLMVRKSPFDNETPVTIGRKSLLMTGPKPGRVTLPQFSQLSVEDLSYSVFHLWATICWQRTFIN